MAYILLAADASEAFEKAKSAHGQEDAFGAVIEQHPPDAVLGAGWSTYDDAELNRAKWRHTWIEIRQIDPRII